ncbi:MAG: DUF2974 domain-containing protein, partial [Lachnospiraceae bacterium]|nr:DUF2974 domain-containing protein [Lachnospiraceae bacterium]
MANIYDYLDWRADIPFSTDPFNEVDALVLCELAYVDFSGVLKNKDEFCSITELHKRFFELHTKEEIMAEDSYVKETPFLLRKMKKSVRFGDVLAGRYVNIVSKEKEEQMSAITFVFDDFDFISFRGTDDTIVGWKEDFNMSFLPATSGQKAAARYVSETGGDKPLLIGGHSKGGNFAVYAAAFCSEEVKPRIRKVYTFDGPGFIREVTETREYRELLPKIASIIPEGSVMGLLLEDGYPHKIVGSTAKGIKQHDGQTWEVRRNCFVTAQELTRGSIFADKTLTRWIESFDHEE